MALIRDRCMLIIGNVMAVMAIVTPIAAWLLIEGIEEGIGGRVLSAIGAQRMIVVATIGKRTRAAAGACAAARIKIITIGGASH